MIVLDRHEPVELYAHIMQAGVEVDREPLDTGDIMVADYLIERKEYGDFIGRLVANEISIWRQLDAMRAGAADQGLQPALILEGLTDDFGHSDANDRAVLGAVASIFEGTDDDLPDVTILPSPSTEGTAVLISLIDDDREHSPQSLRNSPAISHKERPQFLVEGLPNIGPQLAQRLLDEFGTALGVFTASEEDLMSVTGIGSTTAQAIHEALNSDGDE